MYRIIWRWHFYAGLCCIPIILTLSISGSIYLFKPQIDAWVNRPYQNLTTVGQRTTANQQIEAALKATPGATFSSYQLPEHVHQAVVIHLRKSGEKVRLYINPYTLDVLKKMNEEDQFIQMVRAFHGELLAGKLGSVVVELAACWAIVLVITGLYLWWPRSAMGLAGALYPRLSQGGRVFWRDLHAVTGVWISAMVLFLLISGLPWTLVWGSVFKELRQWHTTPVVQDWVISPTVGTDDIKRRFDRINLSENVLTNAVNLNFAPPVLLSVSRDDPSVWSVTSQHQNRPLRAEASLRSETGEVLSIETFQQRALLDRIIGIGIAVHEGQLFGWFNVVLGVITAIGLMILSVSGFVLWRKRHPVRVLGAPPPLPDARVGNMVKTITVVLAAFLPLLAISMVIIALIECLVLRRFTSIRKWLGLQEGG